jgi:hypothetical protein
MVERVTARSQQGDEAIVSNTFETGREPPVLGFWKTLAWGIPLALTAVLFQTIGALGYLGLWRHFHPQKPISIASAATNGAVLAFSLAVSAPALILLLVWIIRQTRVPVADYLGLKWPGWRDMVLGFLALALVLGGTSGIATWLGKDSPAFISDTFTSAASEGMLPLLLLSFVILAPLQEELIFRGFFLRGFVPAIGLWPAILVTSGVWAVSHGQYEWFFVGEIFALGIVLGWIRCRSGSLIASFILHATVNGMAVVAAASGIV